MSIYIRYMFDINKFEKKKKNWKTVKVGLVLSSFIDFGRNPLMRPYK